MKQVSQEMVGRYVRYLKLQRNMSGNTLDAYQRDLRKLLDYLEAEDKDPREVQLEDLEHFSPGCMKWAPMKGLFIQLNKMSKVV